MFLTKAANEIFNEESPEIIRQNKMVELATVPFIIFFYLDLNLVYSLFCLLAIKLTGYLETFQQIVVWINFNCVYFCQSVGLSDYTSTCLSTC